MSLNAYERARTMVESPRGAEYRLMSQITGDMMQARDSGLSGAALVPVLHRNREVWSAFSGACAATGNQLPDALRASIISIGLWVDRFTSDVVAGRDSIEELISVNCSIIDGLRHQNALAA
ncbi:flagellar biosynthesis regulator FlaF [Sphingomonas sp. ac-8]|uniref:flagellar biosynthesis regulator FlaF n=1 Tax=Sphingomonas sp. ac-8 TaxID=3242977 RepID=UPI003A80A82B